MSLCEISYILVFLENIILMASWHYIIMWIYSNLFNSFLLLGIYIVSIFPTYRVTAAMHAILAYESVSASLCFSRFPGDGNEAASAGCWGGANPLRQGGLTPRLASQGSASFLCCKRSELRSDLHFPVKGTLGNSVKTGQLRFTVSYFLKAVTVEYSSLFIFAANSSVVLLNWLEMCLKLMFQETIP